MVEPPEPDERIEALVAQALAALDRGGDAALAAVLPSEPEVAARVRAIVARLTDFGLAGSSAPPTLPERLGGHRVLREIGRGGMGVVYEVFDDALARHLALKVVRPEWLAHAAARERFEREVAAVARVSHPAIVPVLAAGADGGLPYYVMPLVDGCSIEAAVERLARRSGAVATGAELQAVLGAGHDLHGTFAGPYWQAAVRLVRQVALGIHAAHERGVVHRDLKPSNVLLTGDGRALVVDFGLAQVRGSVRLTRSGQEPGSPLWMAPEQVRGEPADERTDVYGLGATLWYFVARTTPFRETDPATLPHRITAGWLEPLPRAAAPPELRSVLATAMDPERGRRYASAASFAADLDAVLTGRPVAARSLPWSVRARRGLRRHRAVAGALAASLLVLPLLLGMLWYREHVLGLRLQQQRDRADAALRDYDLLSGVVRHEQLLERAEALYPSWPERLSALTQWAADADSLLAMLPDLDRTLAQLRDAAPTPGSAQHFLANTLTELQRRLVEFRARIVPANARARRWASHIGEISRAHPRAGCSWAEVRAAIAVSPRYAGRHLPLDDAEVVGLVPIGCNPVTRLFEFYELRSAWDGEMDPREIPIPEHAPDGSIAVGDATGIVFVLLPGGPAWMGAQSDDAERPGFDAEAQPTSPWVSATLAPFFMARHELTQAQWARLCTWDESMRLPSHYLGGRQIVDVSITTSHPVEHVSWTAADELLRRHGMVLPTEAQWEYACRALTTTPWWPGTAIADLEDTCNVLDGTAAAACPEWAPGDALEDGFIFHAPVGSFMANPFGLFDVHGNVWEWCRDTWCGYEEPAAAGDGERTSRTSTNRVARGGCFARRAASAKSWERFAWDPSLRSGEVGVRPARALRR